MIGTKRTPLDLYDCKQAVAFALPLLQVELRNHDFFMGTETISYYYLNVN